MAAGYPSLAIGSLKTQKLDHMYLPDDIYSKSKLALEFISHQYLAPYVTLMLPSTNYALSEVWPCFELFIFRKVNSITYLQTAPLDN